jgi:hypothetical protein
MRPATLFLPALIIVLLAPAPGYAEEECTTAVVTGLATPDGRPLLWKNRDTNARSNKVVHVREQPYCYVAVTNAAEPSGRVVWGGLNERGFAIINSVAYNLPRRGGEMSDLEGLVMADALRTCATIQEFEAYLARNLGESLGCWTNFLVIDAEGGAAIFEVHNHGYARLEADTASSGYVLNTNFSRSGRELAGEGYLRFQREEELFDQQRPEGITVEFLLQDAARDLGHVLLKNPARTLWSSFPADPPRWLHTRHTIDRNITASSILVHGVRRGEDPLRATLWVILGEPLCSIAVPVWVAAGETPPELRQGDDAPIVLQALRLDRTLRPLSGGAREEYVDLTRLDNSQGTGWLPRTLAEERSIIEETQKFLQSAPGAEAMAEFQRAMAARALATLRAIP